MKVKKELKGPILFVEDNYGTRQVSSERLEKNGYFVVGYASGEEAVENIKNGLKYKLAIVDLSLPEPVSGEDVIKLSKKINPDVPVISISGFNLSDYKRKIGSDRHLTKPFWHGKLAEAVNLHYPREFE